MLFLQGCCGYPVGKFFLADHAYLMFQSLAEITRCFPWKINKVQYMALHHWHLKFKGNRLTLKGMGQQGRGPSSRSMMNNGNNLYTCNKFTSSENKINFCMPKRLKSIGAGNKFGTLKVWGWYCFVPMMQKPCHFLRIIITVLFI